jgi:ATP-dependent helicase/nuclease subunit A
MPVPDDLPLRGAMSATTFTAEQTVAIEERFSAFALAANAGSGKTSVLVERFVRAVKQDGISPSQILAITFTDRAAGELRARVRKSLIASDEREAARESASAFISTFHGFCTRILRAHPLLAGLAPDFVVLDDRETAELRDRAFRTALAEWLKGEGALDLAAAFEVEELQLTVFAVYDELRSRGDATPSLPALPPPKDHVPLRAVLAATAAAFAAELGGAKSNRTVDGGLDTLADCTALLSAADVTVTAARLRGLKLSGGANATKTALADAYERARLECECALADELGASAVGLIDELLQSFGARFAALKRARGGADFDDLELEAAALLHEHQDVAALWRGRFERLMVDELQDTNARQMAILAALERDNLFTVGDEFQSIYAFRHADVSIFRDRFSSLQASNRAKVLSANFRSRAVLLESVNAVFAPIWGASNFVALTPGRDDASAGAPVELLLTDIDNGGWSEHEQLLGTELAPAPLWRRAEARLLAARIDELIRAGEASPGDIVVLLRAATGIGAYESAIADLGYATLAAAGEGFYGRPEIKDLTAYVQALANPLDELALYSVLASPLCGATADALTDLALQARETDASVWQALEANREDPALVEFADRFAAARHSTAHRSLSEILAAAVRDHRYDLYLCQLHSPERRLANVRKLARLAREFEAREGRELRRFADALAAERLGARKETEASPAVTDVIRLTTIHKAKGLEFPVVCLADLGHQPNRRVPRLLIDGQRVGLRLPTFERQAIDTLDFAALSEERREASDAEEQRVFYVAMTRAQERLILSGAAPFKSLPRPESTPISWLGRALVPDLDARAAEGGAAAAEVPGVNGIPIRLTLSSPATVGTVLAQSPQSAPPTFAEPGGPDLASPPRPGRTPDIGLLSYSALADYERCAYRYYLQRIIGLPDAEPPFGEAAERGIGAAGRGVVVHALLEQSDFSAPRPVQPAALEAAAAAAGLALDDDADRSEIAVLADAFAQSPLLGRLAACRDVRREEPFAFTLENGELLRGFVDVCGIERNGTLLVVDYKTDRLSDDTDLAARIERDYAVQRLVYALAGLEGGAPAVEIAYCFLRAPDDVVSTIYAVGDQPNLKADLRKRLSPLRSGRFDVTPLPGRDRCGTCPGRTRLCSYDESVTLAVPGGEPPLQTRLDI